VPILLVENKVDDASGHGVLYGVVMVYMVWYKRFIARYTEIEEKCDFEYN
jgi:hypothetical protein